jgi:hypothetical protein
MVEIPQTLEDAIADAKACTRQALADGCTRIQIELVVPEIALQAQDLALEFTELFSEYGGGLKVLFPDTGAAALARRDWGKVAFKVSDLGSRRTPLQIKLADDDEIFLVVCPSAVEVEKVEELCNWANPRPVVLLIPQLEDVAIVGIGLAARQLRERFINTIESAYYFRPLDGAVVMRNYPNPWQVCLEMENGYELISQQSQKPIGEDLERLIAKARGVDQENAPAIASKKPNLLGNIQSFLRALSN